MGSWKGGREGKDTKGRDRTGGRRERNEEGGDAKQREERTLVAA